ncbi:Winged helix-turn-helix transcription repressor DNA-binding [Penicillium coprophilum]|uniref:Winged helix-turn-helix transcription repressor DNA-binding n=1 Tax=Penicillium coprophilum TaxID=36646 RepID=UPI00238DB48F|nr:Winged helix-turn-helix transcription repressor DNA-binding [Penicillium coprophilum]KAJ5163268.1 Winged helix-turn-helix transcription repressor DNA-binding [Penicillium coprophilum]
MDFSFHSHHFDRVQISDQESNDIPSLEAPSQGNGDFTMNAPTFNHFSLPDWARWRSQPAHMPPRQFEDCNFPRVADAETPDLGSFSQEPIGDPNGYLNSYRTHVTPAIAGTTLETLAPQTGDGHANWSLLQPSHAFKGQPYSYPQLEPYQPSPDSPPSPLSEVSSYHSPQSLAASSPAMMNQSTDRLSPRSSTGDHREERPGHPPYSVLIYQALKDAPGHKLQLQSIYSWFEANTDKGADPNAKGWQNSIRHNLSMNAGFEAVKEEVGPGKKAVNFWRLTPEAIHSGGIQSTTRYRKLQHQKKGMGSGHRGPTHQPSQYKGVHATKVVKSRSTNSPRSERAEAYHQQIPDTNPSLGHEYGPASLPVMQRYMQHPMGPVVGCTPMIPGNNTVFIDTTEPVSAFDVGHSHDWSQDPLEGPGRSSWDLEKEI